MISIGDRLNDFTPTPDTIGSVIISSALAVVAQDWPTGAKVAVFDSSVAFYLNFWSTAVTVPSTNSAGTTSSSGINMYQPTGHEHMFRIPSGSTGYSITSPSTGIVTIGFWSV